MVSTVCALVLTALVIRRELVRPPQAASVPKAIENWRRYSEGGHWLTSQRGDQPIVIFSDFQCPYCRTLTKLLHSLGMDSRNTRTIIYRHYPLLGQHPEAFRAAVASECAARQGRFRAYHDGLFANQQRVGVGLDIYTEIGETAGLADTRSFLRCMKDSSAMARVQDDMRAAQELGVIGTPAILVDGHLYNGLPSLEEITRIFSLPNE